MQKPENLVGLSANDFDSSTSGSPASSSRSSQNRVTFGDVKDGCRKSVSRRGDEASVVDSLPERTQAGDLFTAAAGGRQLPPVRKFYYTCLCLLIHASDRGSQSGYVNFEKMLLLLV